MNPPITEMEAKDLLDKVARKSKARAEVASRPAYSLQVLASSFATGVAVFAMSDFTAPMAVKILISIGFVGGIVGPIDAWVVRRRLDAAIELLRQSEEERGKGRFP